MPKNTYFIKENYKKVEEVREIKDEYKIPSYEEFLENYEKESSVNYEDLTHIDVSSSRGYGPCSRSDCNCQYGEKWMNFETACPFDSCSNKEVYTWTHTPGCGSKLEISNKIRIRCSGCSFVCQVKDYHFKQGCSMSPGGHIGWVSADSLVDAIGVYLKLFPNKHRDKKILIREISNSLMDGENWRKHVSR